MMSATSLRTFVSLMRLHKTSPGARLLGTSFAAILHAKPVEQSAAGLHISLAHGG
jgi:hypothetical protein